MDIPNEKCLKAIIEFSESYNLTLPQSNDFDVWCSRAVNEMKQRDVQLFYLAVKGALNSGLGCKEIVSKMFYELEKRKLQIDQSIYAI